MNNDNDLPQHLDRMKSVGSDEEDAPPNATYNNNSNNTPKRTYFNDLDVDSNTNSSKKKSKSKKKKKKKKKKKRSNSNGVPTNPKFKKNDSFDGFNLNAAQEEEQLNDKERESGSIDTQERERERSISAASKKYSKEYSKDDMTVSSGCDEDENNGSTILMKPGLTRRVTSADGYIGAGSRKSKQIIVLPSLKKKVVSPPPINSKSEFQMLLRPTMSADAIALKKRNMK